MEQAIGAAAPAAESERQQNVQFKLKRNLIFCDQQILNL